MSEARHIPALQLRKDPDGRGGRGPGSDRLTLSQGEVTNGAPFHVLGNRVAVYPLARGHRWQDTEIARWAMGLVRRLSLPTDPVGRGVELDGDNFADLQQHTLDAFVRPVYRIILHEPLLAFRFYGDLCLPISRLYTSIATVRQIPRFGWIAKELLGLTGRNSADHLVAVRVEPGSQIAVGGISGRAPWADQIFVELDRGLVVVGHLSQAECESNGGSKRAS